MSIIGKTTKQGEPHIDLAVIGLVRKLSKGRFLTLRYKFGQKWYQTDRVDVSNQDVKKFVLHITT